MDNSATEAVLSFSEMSFMLGLASSNARIFTNTARWKWRDPIQISTKFSKSAIL